MNQPTNNSFGQSTLSDREIKNAATDFLASSTERRKRSRSQLVNEADKKRREAQQKTINVEAARKSAIQLARDSPSYKKLVELEERLDLAIMRKQQDIKEGLKNDFQSESRVFRLFLLNTHRSQPGTNGVTEDDVPSWSLRIQGQLLPKGEESKSNGGEKNSEMNENEQPPTMSHPSISPVHIRMSNDPMIQGGTAGLAMGAQNMGNLMNPQHPIQTMGPMGGMNPIQGLAQQSILNGPPPKCSDVFHRIVVELDKELYPENNLIEWKRNDREPSSDGFEISRAGSKEFTAKIFLYVDQKPEQFRVSPLLCQLIGLSNGSKASIFSGVWQYVKMKKLQCVDDRTAVRLDPGLKTLLSPANINIEVIKIQQLFALIKGHMGPPEPIVLKYNIKLSGDVVDNQDCYDIQVNVQDTTLLESARKAGVFGMELEQSKDYEILNETHLGALERLALHKKRRDFFEGFCSNPVQFINHLILSQTRDLKVLGGNTGRNPEEERRASFYQQQWVHEAVPRYLLRKAIADTAEDTVESGLK